MSKKVIIVIAAAFVLIMGMMGAGFFLMWQKMTITVAQVQGQNEDIPIEEEEEVPENTKMGPIYKMETLIVNLADQGGKRYLRVTMELELSASELVSEIDMRLPQLRDALLMILPTKQYTDISSTEGKIRLRDEILNKMNSILKTGTIATIYFSEFVVQ